jgi:hypothetical protein
MERTGLVWLHELRMTMRDPVDAITYRYCRLRAEPGTNGERASWGSVTYFFEVDSTGLPVRQLQIYDYATFTYHFDRDHPNTENLRGERFGGGLRSTPVSVEQIETGRITHREFEHAWLTGHLGERTVADYRDELLCNAADEGATMLWEAWAVAEKWYPFHGAASTLDLAERAIGHFLDSGLAELVSLRITDQSTEEIVQFSLTRYTELLIDRRSWMSPPIVWFQITERGLEDLRERGKIR